MRWILAAALLAALPTWPVASMAQARDDWFGPDKAKHFVASAGIAGAGYLLTLPWTDDDVLPFVVGGSLSAAAGVGKELYDLASGSYVSGRDLVWDALGIVTGLLVAWTLDEVFGLHGAVSAPDSGARNPPSSSPSDLGTNHGDAPPKPDRPGAGRSGPESSAEGFLVPGRGSARGRGGSARLRETTNDEVAPSAPGSPRRRADSMGR